MAFKELQDCWVKTDTSIELANDRNTYIWKCVWWHWSLPTRVVDIILCLGEGSRRLINSRLSSSLSSDNNAYPRLSRWSELGRKGGQTWKAYITWNCRIQAPAAGWVALISSACAAVIIIIMGMNHGTNALIWVKASHDGDVSLAYNSSPPHSPALHLITIIPLRKEEAGSIMAQISLEMLHK